MKRLIDIVVASTLLLLTSPVLLPVMILVWVQDFRSPFYKALRVARNGGTFTMVKMRSMVVNADRSGVDSTASDDARILPIGRFIRRFKIDELTQMWNVLKGDMSLVGPRPNVQRDVALYTQEEKRLLSVKPGITDLSSIVFADEGDILRGSPNPDLRYNQVIRPWKSRLGLLYISRASIGLDVRILFLTVVALISRNQALRGVHRILGELGADETIRQVVLREEDLKPFPPPGTTQVVEFR